MQCTIHLGIDASSNPSSQLLCASPGGEKPMHKKNRKLINPLLNQEVLIGRISPFKVKLSSSKINLSFAWETLKC